MSSSSNVTSAKNVDIRTCEFDWVWDASYNDNLSCDEPIDSSSFSAKNNHSIKWCLRWGHTELQLIATGENMHSTDFNDMLDGTYGGEIVLSLQLPDMQKMTLEGAFMLNQYTEETEYDEKLVHKFLLRRSQFIPDFIIKCKITFFKLLNAIPLFISNIQDNTIPFEVTVSNPLEDFGKLYLNKERSDVIICIKSNDEKLKEYPGHKIVLTVRSKVFEAMFKHDMKENKHDRVVVEHIKEEVFLEALRYIYTGKVQNLDALVYELLPVADRYDLEKLIVTCGNVLCKKLSVDTALKIVTLADMYNVDDLKKKAIKFIKDHSDDVSKKMDSNAWNDLMSKPHLMKDLLMANMTS